MRVQAFAKINLSLRVLGTRSDGYHELRTIFQSIALHDTLTIRARRGAFALTCDDPACPTDETNLDLPAPPRGCGARPDAAARRVTWRSICRNGSRCRRGWAAEAAMQRRRCARSRNGGASARRRLRAAAADLGADVPYFLEGGAVLGLERGDLLFRLAEPPPHWVVLVLPGFGVSTKDAFASFDRDRRRNDVARPFRPASAALKGPRHKNKSWSTISRLRSPPGIPRSPASFPLSGDWGPRTRRCPAAARRYSGCFLPAKARLRPPDV